LRQINVSAGDPCFIVTNHCKRGFQLPALTNHTELALTETIVVVIDDDLAVRNSLKFALEIEGFAVHCYATGPELLQANEDFSRCSCLVVDQKMPEMSGLDLIAHLRAQKVAAPALLITSHPSTALRDQASQAGVSIVEKPLLGNTLLDEIRKALGNKC
jgi:FixJ family two-component response regulator